MEKRVGTFSLLSSETIQEINAEMEIWQEETLGLKVMYLRANDPQNVFCISFPTMPESDNGVAHVLEHTVLCGSKKYPIKDPFFEMTRRSLNTFMNAFTGPDFTCYPAASQEKEDFYNLLDVYLDSVFFPLLEKKSFLQEGQRLEFLDPSDENSPLVRKGIVYNEMKGAYNTAQSHIHYTIYQNLFPDLPYKYDSGGTPKAIATLTYKDLKAFHEKYYHPSRALFFFYGNIPVEEHFAFLEKRLLSQFKKLPPLEKLPLQERFNEPRRVKIFYPSSNGDDENRSYLALSWLTCPVLEQRNTLLLEILLRVLMENDASFLKRSLLDTKLCKQASVSIDSEIREVPITFFISGCDEKDVETLEKHFIETLKKFVETPIDKEVLYACLHQIELSRLEITEDPLPYGLYLFMQGGLLLQHGGNPADSLKIHDLFIDLKKDEELLDRDLRNLCAEFFLKNHHQVVVTAIPDSQISLKEEMLEREELKTLKEGLSFDEKQKIIEDSIALKEYQELEEDSSILPTIHFNRVDPKPRDIPLKLSSWQGISLYHDTCFTNGISYLTYQFPLEEMDLEEVPYLRLLSVLLYQMGTKKTPWKDFVRKVNRDTGGINTAVQFHPQAENPAFLNPHFVIGGKAIDANIGSLAKFLTEICCHPGWDENSRILEILTKHHHGVLQSVQNHGMRYAMSIASQDTSYYGRVMSLYSGYYYLRFLQNLYREIEKDPLPFIEKMQEISKKIFTKAPDVVLTASEKGWQTLEDVDFFHPWQEREKKPSLWNHFISNREEEKIVRTISSSVAYTVETFDGVSYAHQDAPALSLASSIMDNRTLHPEIRERGGAYGSGSQVQFSSGLFSFHSYRDPHIKHSFHIYNEAKKSILKDPPSEEDMHEARLEVLQQLDAPWTPGSRAEIAMGWKLEGKTYKMREKFRRAILDCNVKEVIDALERHLKTPLKSVAVCGSVMVEKEQLEGEWKVEPLIENL